MLCVSACKHFGRLRFSPQFRERWKNTQISLFFRSLTCRYSLVIGRNLRVIAKPIKINDVIACRRHTTKTSISLPAIAPRTAISHSMERVSQPHHSCLTTAPSNVD